MQVDSTTLDDALNNNFNTVANLFQATLTSSSPNLQPSGTNMSSFTGSITFGITMSGSNISALTATSGGQSVASQFLFAGTTIQGAPGTPYAGMYLNYTGTGETATVTSSQGLANQVYSVSNDFASSTSGSLETLITGKQSQNLQFTSQYNNWISEANDYTNFLLTQYSSLTTQIQSAGETLTTLTALMNASNSSS